MDMNLFTVIEFLSLNDAKFCSSCLVSIALGHQYTVGKDDLCQDASDDVYSYRYTVLFDKAADRNHFLIMNRDLSYCLFTYGHDDQTKLIARGVTPALHHRLMELSPRTMALFSGIVTIAVRMLH